MARVAHPAVIGGDFSAWTAEDVAYFGPAVAGLAPDELSRLCPVLVGAATKSARDLFDAEQRAALLQCSRVDDK